MKGTRKSRRKWILLGVLLFSSVFVFYFFILPLEFFRAKSRPIPPLSPESGETPAQAPPHQVIEGRIKEGSSFSKSLAEKKIPTHWIEMIVSKLRPYVNFKKIRGGTYRLVMDVKGELVRFVYEAGPTEIYEV
jgi:mRNA-degrading endonuclease RelE of RelBE toxin-antitoxin system